MINIVHIETDFDEHCRPTKIRIKIKFIPDETNTATAPPYMAPLVSVALYNTALLQNGEYRNIKVTPNPKRPEIIDLSLSLTENNTLSYQDLAQFYTDFQKTLNHKHGY